MRFAWYVGGGAQCRFAHQPDLRGFPGIIQEFHGWGVAGSLQLLHQCVCTRMSILPVLAAKLDQEPAASLWQQFNLSEIQVLLSHILDETTIEALQSNRFMGHYFHSMVGCNVGIWISKHQERACGGAMHMAGRCFQYCDAGTFCPN